MYNQHRCHWYQCSVASTRNAHTPVYINEGAKGAGLRLLERITFQILFHPPVRGTFHLSLTVLVHYRSLHLFSLGWWSTRIRAGLHVSDLT